MANDRAFEVRVSLTNVTGLGAAELVKSLLPALERRGAIGEIYLPAKGELSTYRRISPGPKPQGLRRRLPNALSRIVECTLLSSRFESSTPLLVLGDLPLRIRARQTVLVHTPHLLPRSSGLSVAQKVKMAIARTLFRANCSFIDAAIVQSEPMRNGLAKAYPAIADRIHIVAQPPPEWLVADPLERRGRITDQKLDLCYPAAPYPHKNHAVLFAAAATHGWRDNVETLTLTIAPEQGERGSSTPSIRAVGRLDHRAMRSMYQRTDALIFPSLAESYGLPLVEAMSIGLPILCADRAYARTLCGDVALYFDPEDPEAVGRAVALLRQRLADGWWPDWSDPLAALPKNWDEVAARMAAIAIGDIDLSI